MGALIRSRDWTKTPLGEPASWPQSLKTAKPAEIGALQALLTSLDESPKESLRSPRGRGGAR